MIHSTLFHHTLYAGADTPVFTISTGDPQNPYTTVQGDTLNIVALKTGVPLATLRALNTDLFPYKASDALPVAKTVVTAAPSSGLTRTFAVTDSTSQHMANSNNWSSKSVLYVAAPGEGVYQIAERVKKEYGDLLTGVEPHDIAAGIMSANDDTLDYVIQPDGTRTYPAISAGTQLDILPYPPGAVDRVMFALKELSKGQASRLATAAAVLVASAPVLTALMALNPPAAVMMALTLVGGVISASEIYNVLAFIGQSASGAISMSQIPQAADAVRDDVAGAVVSTVAAAKILFATEARLLEIKQTATVDARIATLKSTFSADEATQYYAKAYPATAQNVTYAFETLQNTLSKGVAHPVEGYFAQLLHVDTATLVRTYIKYTDSIRTAVQAGTKPTGDMDIQRALYIILTSRGIDADAFCPMIRPQA